MTENSVFLSGYLFVPVNRRIGFTKYPFFPWDCINYKIEHVSYVNLYENQPLHRNTDF